MARVDQAAMVDFLPAVERVDQVDRVILASARYKSGRGGRGGTGGTRQQGGYWGYGWARCGRRQRRHYKLHVSLQLARKLGFRR